VEEDTLEDEPNTVVDRDEEPAHAEDKENITIKTDELGLSMLNDDDIITSQAGEPATTTELIPTILDIPESRQLDNLEVLAEMEPELTEIDFNCTLEDTVEEIKLKKPNQVYFELYKEAKKKAKLAKRSAIIAYLEAKNIKKTYMIENVNDSDSDFDAEIDEVSESELESF
jgi:beta-xylosidase